MTGKSGDQPANILESIVPLWKKLLPIAAFIMGTIGSIGVDPPYSAGSDNANNLINFARFIVAAVIVLMVLPTIKKVDRKRQAMLWGKVAVIALIASIAVFFIYDNKRGEWTVTHKIGKDKQKVLVVGSRDDLRDDAKEFVANNPDVTDWELLNNAAWSPYKIWDIESIRRRRFILSAMYVLFTPLFAVTMVAVAQVMNCAIGKK
jgi:hypothetical protein